MGNFKIDIKNQIVALLEQEYSLSINDRIQQKIMFLINQLHGHSFRQGFNESSEVNKKIQGLRSQFTTKDENSETN